MKKIYNKLLIISIICAIISFALCFFSTINSGFDFTTTKGVVNDVNEMGSDNPGAGWYLLIAGGTAAMAEFAAGIAKLIIVILIPSLMLFIIMISQCIARLVQIGEEKKWKDITSKVITYISIVLQILVCFVLIFNLLSNLSFNKILVFISLVLNIVCVVLFIKELVKTKKLSTQKIMQ